mmetsp:Transcript_22784/g.68289  ORF Transcript_22784/g.68289 Transcript_22784/m.68289 type:complete len:326 (+) Transcript_22784:912-1889(+)
MRVAAAASPRLVLESSARRELRLRRVGLVRDHRVDPRALVIRVFDHRRFPLALVLRIINHGRLPLAVFFFVPILGRLRLGVGDLGRDVVVALGLGGLGVGDLLRVDPVLGLGLVGVLDLLVRERPAVDDVARGLGDLVEEDLVGAVLLEDERVQVRELVLVRVVQLDLLLLEQILAAVLEDEVDARDVVAAEVGAEHDGVGRVAAEGLAVDLAGQQLDVAAAAERVVLLLVLHRVLEHERALLRRRFRVEGRGDGVELHVLGRLHALRQRLVDEPLARRVDPLARRVRVLPLGRRPSLRDVLVERLLEIDFRLDGRERERQEGSS